MTTNPPEDPRESLAEGSLISHLIELRDRLMRAVIAVVVCFVPCAFFSDELFTAVAQPLLAKMPKGAQMIATSITAPVMAPLKLSLLTGLFIAMPYVLYQAWAFVAPGLYKHEKRFAIPLMLSSIVLFYAGAAFAYFVVFPLMFGFLTAAAPAGIQVMTDMSNYLDFVLLLFFGYVILGIFILAAFLTPPDAVSQSFMAIPMYLLYEGGIIMSRILLKKRAEQDKDKDGK
jgi:sec-independent protein translocase protein TatC